MWLDSTGYASKERWGSQWMMGLGAVEQNLLWCWSLIPVYCNWAPEGRLSYQHLPEWVCEEKTTNRLQ